MTQMRKVLLRPRDPKPGDKWYVQSRKEKGRGKEEHVREWAESAKHFLIEEEVQSPR